MAAVAGCAAAQPAPRPDPTSTAPGQLPLAQVTAVAIDPADHKLQLAGDGGLYEWNSGRLAFGRGPVIELTAIIVIGPEHFLASGQPPASVDLPHPTGLIETTDGGLTWEPLSGGGRSEFTALTGGGAGILGYDGILQRSTDGGHTFTPLSIPAAPGTLAAAPEGAHVLATTPQGLLRSDDAGTSWSTVAGAPALRAVAWADATTTVGVDATGTVWTSGDTGGTWQQTAELDTAPQALAAATDGGDIRIDVAADDQVLESRDGGRSFTVVLQR
jgi:hypothetical protein